MMLVPEGVRATVQLGQRSHWKMAFIDSWQRMIIRCWEKEVNNNEAY